jgi:uncharacterized protein YndB with AHSA1/START domain
VAVSEINSVVSETRIAATRQAVFAFFVDAHKMVQWMGVRAELDARRGGYVRSRHQRPGAPAVGTSRSCRTHALSSPSAGEGDQVVPPGSGTVEVTLTPDGDGTYLRLVQRGLMTSEMREQHRRGWQQYLERLSVAATGATPGPDPTANPPQEDA